jgi:hypothetical protein
VSFAPPYYSLSAVDNQPSRSPKVMSRMRLQAAVSLLHLSTVPVYATAIAPRFLKLAIVVQVGDFRLAAFWEFSDALG